MYASTPGLTWLMFLATAMLWSAAVYFPGSVLFQAPHGGICSAACIRSSGFPGCQEGEVKYCSMERFAAHHQSVDGSIGPARGLAGNTNSWPALPFCIGAGIWTRSPGAED